MKAPLLVCAVTVLTVYVAVILQCQRLPEASETARVAYSRLQEVSQSPHPYNSRRNDEVRLFLKTHIARQCPSARDISNSQALWIGSDEHDSFKKNSTYHEQTNLVIYLPSSRNSVDEAVLLSAHYDSVASGDGATDDGVALVVLLAVIESYCNHSLSSDIVLNLNNAEEDGLFGAQAFVKHPIFPRIKAFINLEGAGAGGPSMLFRASSAEVAAAYQRAALPRSSIAGNDFFEQHLIQSQTDYVVYSPHFPGLDIAFFAPRSIYHTMRDSARTTSAKSVEHMLSAANASLLRLADTSKIDLTDRSRPFFLDILGLQFFSYELYSLLSLDLATLLLAPLILGLSFAMRSYIGKIRFVGIGRTLACLVLQAFLVGVLSCLIGSINPYIVHSSPILYTGTLLTGSFTANLVFTRLLTCKVLEKDDLSRVMTWELCFIWYDLLLASSIFSFFKGIGSTYIITVNFWCSFGAALLSLFETTTYLTPIEHTGPLRLPIDEEEIASETTSLLRSEALAPTDTIRVPSSIERDRPVLRGLLWLAKFIILIPLPLTICLWLLYSAILPGLAQVLPDGSSLLTVYTIIGSFAVVACFNLSPFFLSTKLAHAMPVSTILLAMMTITLIFSPPFDVNAPLKLYYKQSVTLGMPSFSRIAIEGIPGYLEAALAGTVSAPDMSCSKGSTRSIRLHTCTFLASVDKRLDASAITIETSVHEKERNSTLIKINALDSRICDLVVDRPIEISSINGLKIESRESHVRLYRRSWHEPFELVIATADKDMHGTISCAWDDRRDGSIAAFDLLESQLPDWAELTKRETGLLWFSKTLP